MSVIGMLAGSTLIAIHLVMRGHKSWREAGSDTAELVLRAPGVPLNEAIGFTNDPLPALPSLE